jgi:glucose-6-phosphate 1-dehydrogenase
MQYTWFQRGGGVVFEGVIVIFGMPGDLAMQKLLPALYQLMRRKELGNFYIVGASRDKLSVQELCDTSKAFATVCNDDSWQQFCERIKYVELDFSDIACYKQLVQTVQECESLLGGPSNRLLYTSAPPQFFQVITSNSAKVGLIAKGATGVDGKVWHRLAYEKPFGLDQAMADAINVTAKESLVDEQVFRVDHYLMHEMAGNIVPLRMANNLFEPLWNSKHVERVELVMSEPKCPTGLSLSRQMGVLKDTVQSHLFQLFAMVAMELPSGSSDETVRECKAKVLKSTRFVDGVLGIARGCDECDDIKAFNAPSFAALKFVVDTPRWQGVPFFITAGRCLAVKETSIKLFMKAKGGAPGNVIALNITPKAGIVLAFNMQRLDSSKSLETVGMEYCHECTFGVHTPQAYEHLFINVMAGNRFVVVGESEITQAWRLIADIDDKKLEVYDYGPGSMGPKEAINFVAR